MQEKTEANALKNNNNKIKKSRSRGRVKAKTGPILSAKPLLTVTRRGPSSHHTNEEPRPEELWGPCPVVHLFRGRIWTPIRVLLPQTRSCLDHRASSGSGDSEEDVVSLPVPNASICQACAKRLINFDHSICPKDSDTCAQKKRCNGSVSKILTAGVSGDEDFRSLFFSSSELYIWFDFCKQRKTGQMEDKV